MSISVETLALAKKNTKQAVEEALTSVYTYRGSVETLNDLPTSGQKVGDVYNVVSEAGQNYAWDGSNWDALGIAENLGDIEFTDSEGNIKTINEDFWDAEKVGEEINNLSNALSDVSNKTNYGIQKAADANNQANAAFNKANDVSNATNTAHNRADDAYFRAGAAYSQANAAYNRANDAYNNLNNLGNVEFNNYKERWTECKLSDFVLNEGTEQIRTKGIFAYPKGEVLQEVRFEFESNDVLDEAFREKTYLVVGYGAGVSEEIQSPVSGPLSWSRPSINDLYFTISGFSFDQGVTIQRQYASCDLYSMPYGNFHYIFTDLSKVTLKYKSYIISKHTINSDYYDKDATNSLANDTLNAAKAYTDSKFDISLKKEVVQTLPAEGEEDILYLIPKTDAETEDIYDEYIWTNNDWEKIGSTATDLNNYYNKTQIDNMRQLDSRAIEYAANTADNAYDTANDAVNSLNNLGNVEFNNKKTITVNYPKAGNIYFDLNELDNNDVIEFYFPNREEITNYISNHPEVNGELLQIPMFGDTTVLIQNDIASTDIEQYLQRDANTESVSIPVSKIKEWSENKRFAIFPLRLFYKNSSNQIIRSNCYLNNSDNYITYSSNTRETISEKYYEKQEIDDMLNEYSNNNLGNIEFESIKTKVQEQSFSTKQSIFNQSSAMFPNGRGQKIEITQDLDINKIQFYDDMEGYYYLGTVEVENFDEVYELRINDEYNVSTFAGHSNNQTLDNSYVLDTMPIFLYGSPTYRDFDIVVPVNFVTQYCPQNNINFLSFINSCIGQNNTVIKLVNPVFNINYDALIKQTINQNYYDKEDVDNLISNATSTAWELVSTVTTNEATNSVNLPIDKEYDEYLITFNRPLKMDGTSPADSMTDTSGALVLSIGGESVIGGKTDIYEKMNGVYTVKNIVDNMYHATCYYNNVQGAEKSYTENVITINDATNGGAELAMTYGSIANIASNVTITLYGKGGQNTE